MLSPLALQIEKEVRKMKNEEVMDVYWDKEGDNAVVVTLEKAYKYKKEYKPHMLTSEYLNEAAELFEQGKKYLFDEYEGETKI